MTWTRRELLELAGLVGAVATGLPGCGPEEDEGSDLPSWPPFEGCDPDTVNWSWEGDPGPLDLFSHGVASGDPLADAVILWTRVTPDVPEDGVELYWEVSSSPGFVDVVASGVVSTDASRDHTVKVDVACLRPDTTYYYRFSAQGRVSPVGRTRTAPYGATEHVRFAFCSCSNYVRGYFHNYRAIAERADLSVVFHLGDYIYESGESDVREPDPPNEIVTLDDYRRRYRRSRTDPDLLEAHRQHPFVCTWDDHETVNNAWSGGAENHDPDSDGPWEDRKAAARQAYLEWLPVREQVPGSIYRQLLFGDLLDFLVLDTRIEGRDEQASGTNGAYEAGRQLLGAAQEAWLLGNLSDSPSRWKVLAQQIVVADWALGTDDQDRPIPLNRDAWGGYAVARQRLLDHIAGEVIDGVVVLTGDVHSSWANDLVTDFSQYAASTAVGVEAVAPGITSGIGQVGELAASFLVETDHIRWAEGTLRGFVVVDATHERLQCDWHLLPEGSIESSAFTAPELAASWLVRPVEPWWVQADEPIGAGGGAPLAP